MDSGGQCRDEVMFLHQKPPHRLYAYGVAAGVTQRPDGDHWPSQPAYECGKDGRYGFPSMPRRQVPFEGVLRKTYDRVGADISVPPVTVGGLIGVRVRSGGMFNGNSPLYAAQD